MSHSNLRFALQGAINSRTQTLRNGRCLRRDHDAIRVSIGKAEQFLRSYPVANDEQVKQWCVDHINDVTRIVPANQFRVLERLIMATTAPAKPKAA